MTNDTIAQLGARIQMLVIALIILAVVLIGYMVVECGLLLYSSVSKKKTDYSDPESVVVKSSKKSKKGSRKSSKSGKKKPKKSSKSSKTKKVNRRRRSSKASAPLPLQAKKSVKPKEKHEVESASSLKSATSDASRSTVPRPIDTPKPFAGFKADDFTSTGTSTEKLNSKIPPQFGETPKPVSEDFTAGTSTDQINAEIPPQFETPPKKMNVVHPTSQFVREVAEQVVNYLDAQKSPIVNVPQQQGPDVFATPKLAPQAIQQFPVQPAVVSSPKLAAQIVSDDRTIEQQLASPPLVRRKAQDESVFMMDVGSNGEIIKVHPPSPNINATNSLMLDAKNVVPIDGRPNDGPKPSGQQPENAKPTGAKP